MWRKRIVILTLAVLIGASTASAQSGSGYDLTWSTADADGVALAAITALEVRVAELEKASQSGQASAQPAPFNVFNLASVLAFAGVAVLLMQHGVRRMS